METICWDDIPYIRRIQPIYWYIYMETPIQIEARLRRLDSPQNQRDRKLRRDWRGVKFRLVQGEEFPGLTEAIAEDIDQLANNLIPHFVTWLNAWNGTETTGGEEPYTWTMPGELKLHGIRAGAGEPCPCGSARPYGRCCALH